MASNKTNTKVILVIILAPGRSKNACDPSRIYLAEYGLKKRGTQEDMYRNIIHKPDNILLRLLQVENAKKAVHCGDYGQAFVRNLSVITSYSIHYTKLYDISNFEISCVDEKIRNFVLYWL